MAAIRLEDLIKSQQKLKEDEAKKHTTETMSVEEFRKMASEMSDTTPGTTTKSLIKKGLTDKTGEGLNANVIKLTKVIKDATAKKGNVVGSSASIADITPAGRVVKASQDVESAARAQASKYQMGGIGYLQQRAKDISGVRIEGLGDISKFLQGGLSKAIKLKTWFDLEEGKSQGLLGQMIRRRVAKGEYVDEAKAAGTSKKLASRQFDVANKQRGIAQQALQEIDAMRAKGMSEKDIAATGAPARLAKAERSIAIADPSYRKERSADQAIPVRAQTEAKPSLVRVQPEISQSLKTATAEAEKAATDETESENLRTVGEQTATLKRIEENTSILKTLSQQIGKTTAIQPQQEPSDKTPSYIPTRAGGIWGGIKSAARGAASIGRTALGLFGGGSATMGASVLGGALLAGYAGKKFREHVDEKEAANQQAYRVEIEKSGIDVGALKKLPDAGEAWTPSDVSESNRLRNLAEIKVQQKSSFTAEEAQLVEQKLGVVVPAPLVSAATATPAAADRIVPSTPEPQAADNVYKQSGENVAAAQKKPELGTAPVIVNAPTNVNNTSNFGPKSPPRNTESSLQQYNRSKFAMST